MFASSHSKHMNAVTEKDGGQREKRGRFLNKQPLIIKTAEKTADDSESSAGVSKYLLAYVYSAFTNFSLKILRLHTLPPWKGFVSGKVVELKFVISNNINSPFVPFI